MQNTFDRLLSSGKRIYVLTFCLVFACLVFLTKYGYFNDQLRFYSNRIDQTPKIFDALKPYLKPPKTFTERKVMKSFSQAGQEQFVYDLLLKDNGFFIEMGALNGQELSNTFWLENRHRWTGLLIEANPTQCENIDKLGRMSWRLCACISNRENMSFFPGGGLGGLEDHFNENMFKRIKRKNKITVPCFKLQDVLECISRKHVDYFSLDVEGAEMMVLESIKSELKSGQLTVDVWTIEYQVWDGKKIVVEDSMQQLRNLRDYFKSIGGYVEHSHLSIGNKNSRAGYGLDVVFVRNWVWCKSHKTLPDGSVC